MFGGKCFSSYCQTLLSTAVFLGSLQVVRSYSGRSLHQAFVLILISEKTDNYGFRVSTSFQPLLNPKETEQVILRD